MNDWQFIVVMLVAQVTVITAVAALVMALVGPRPALRHGIGTAALALLLFSPMLALCLPRPTWLAAASRVDDPAASAEALQQNPRVDRAVAKPRVDETPIADAALPVSAHAHDPTGVTATLDPLSPATATVTESATPTTEPTPPRSNWRESAAMWGAAAWAAGVVFLFARFLRAQRRLHSLAKTVVPATIEPATAAAVLRALGVSKLPMIGVSDCAPMPLVLGWRRPIVVLPVSLFEIASADRLRDVLIHESAHVLRHDPVIHLAQHIARIAFWPHLGVHWLNQQVARAREEVCDNFVLRGAASADYAETLFELAQTYGDARFGVALLGMFSKRWRLEDRIKGILNPARSRTTRAGRRPLGVAFLLLLAGSLIVGGTGRGAIATNVEEPTADAKSKSGAAEAKTPPVTKPITIRGACFDQEDKPVGQVWVRVFRWGDPNEPVELLGEARSEANGAFVIPNVNVRVASRPDAALDRLQLVATAAGRVSTGRPLNANTATEDISLKMPDKPAAISGVITDASGKPIEGAEVFLPCCGTACIPQYRSAISDKRGRYVISDLAPWKPVLKEFVGPDGERGGSIVTSVAMYAKHPDFALTQASYSLVPQEVDIVLPAPALLVGTVVDEVTGAALADIVVGAQGIGRGEWLQGKTDQAGAFRIKANADTYNLWALADDRIAVAAHNVVAAAGQTVDDIRVHMVRGGFIVGTVIDHTTDKPVVPAAEQPVRVAHHGPARPRSGAAVLSTPVAADGTYRLRVAPGKNYVYLMGGGNSGYVDVADGAEVKLDLRTAKQQQRDPLAGRDPDVRLREKLLRAAQVEKNPKPKFLYATAAAPTEPEKRKRADTKAGRLLGELDDMNAGSALFTDSWLGVMKEIVEIGPDALPELVAELDATDKDMMIRCCGFMLRAMGDKRGVPALVRAFPKTLLKPGSDMGLKADDKDLAAWAQKFDIDNDREGTAYGFGRPVREVSAALEKLTSQKMGEEELFHVFLTGLQSQRYMKRLLFYQVAKKWSDWWEAHAGEFTKDAAYQVVKLGPPPDKPAKAAPGAHFKTGSSNSNWILEPVFNPKSHIVFFDFDTERAASLPSKWKKDEDRDKKWEEITAWAAAEGYDMMGSEYELPDGQRVYALRALDMDVWELDPKNWKREIGDTTLEEMKAAGRRTDGWLLHYDAEKRSVDPKATGSFYYITREGTPGLIFVGIEVKDDSLKPGGVQMGDSELDPVAFSKGRRFGYTPFEEVK